MLNDFAHDGLFDAAVAAAAAAAAAADANKFVAGMRCVNACLLAK